MIRHVKNKLSVHTLKIRIACETLKTIKLLNMCFEEYMIVLVLCVTNLINHNFNG